MQFCVFLKIIYRKEEIFDLKGQLIIYCKCKCLGVNIADVWSFVGSGPFSTDP